MTRYLLHIGTHKTGTTSIQACLAASRDYLLAHGFDFPLIGRTNQGSQAHRHFPPFFRGKAEKHPPDFEASIRGGIAQAPTCVLSAEEFYIASETPAIARMQSYFGSDVRVLCYLRDPVSHAVSLHKEVAKVGDIRTLQAFLADHTAAMLDRDRFAYYRYEGNLALWRQAFAVEIARYDPAGDAVFDLVERWDLPLGPDASRAEPRTNASLGEVASLLLRTASSLRRSGRIDDATWARYKKRIMAHDSLCTEMAGPFVRRCSVDTSAFEEAFARANRGLLDMLASSPAHVETAEALALSAEDAIALLDGLPPPEKRR